MTVAAVKYLEARFNEQIKEEAAVIGGEYSRHYSMVSIEDDVNCPCVHEYGYGFDHIMRKRWCMRQGPGQGHLYDYGIEEGNSKE